MTLAHDLKSPSPEAPDRLSGRVELYRSILTAPAGFNPSAFFGDFCRELPYRLGESLADASFPFALSDDLTAAAEAATADLFELLRRRREGDSDDPLLGGPKLPPPRLSVKSLADPFPRGLAMRASRLDPALDAGLTETWLGRGTPAATFAQQLHALFARAVDEDLASGAKTAFSYLAVLAVLSLCDSKKTWAKVHAIRGLSYERLEKALGFALFAAAEGALEAALAPSAGKRAAEAQVLTARCLCALNPLPFCSIRARALQNDLNPWSLSQDLCATLDGVLGESTLPQPRELESRLGFAVRGDSQLRARAARAGALIDTRRRIFDWLFLLEGLDPDLTRALAEAAWSDPPLATLLDSPKALLGPLRRLEKSKKLDPPQIAATAALAEALRRGPEPEDTAPLALGAFLAHTFDRLAAPHVDRARSRLLDRRAEFPLQKLKEEYGAGRLYRLAGDGRPLLMALQRKKQGHLFIDLKGFTQRTYRAKELVMAEFLKREFYEPILQAAARYAVEETYGGSSPLVLQNLLGDAAVFSGEVSRLIDLARDIQRLCGEYARKLAEQTPVDLQSLERQKLSLESEGRAQLERLQIERTMVETESRRKAALSQESQEALLWDMFARRIRGLGQKREEALARGAPEEAERHRRSEDILREREREIYGKVEKLAGPERDRLVNEMVGAPETARLAEIDRAAGDLRQRTALTLRGLEQTLRDAAGYGLEAGLFIAHGNAAELVQISDRAFGAVNVAIAEKINEAARGTARNGTLKTKLEGHVARARTRNSGVHYPFNVYVDSTYSMTLNTELNDMAERAVRAKEPEQARYLARLLGEAALRDLSRAMGRGDGQPPELLSVLNDIYNVGEAVSGEALDAYLAETAGARFAFRKSLSYSELPAEIHAAFCFVGEGTELVVSLPESLDLHQAVLFRFAGNVHFRGLEAKEATAVWEILRPQSELFRMLCQHCLGVWVAEARAEQPPCPSR